MENAPFVGDLELLQFLTSEGYSCIVCVPGRGVCGVMRMVFTTGLFYNLQGYYYEGRYCFHTWAEAVEALSAWDGTGDPPGDWIKHKGGSGEYSNPNNDI